MVTLIRGHGPALFAQNTHSVGHFTQSKAPLRNLVHIGESQRNICFPCLSVRADGASSVSEVSVLTTPKRGVEAFLLPPGTPESLESERKCEKSCEPWMEVANPEGEHTC